MTFPFQNSYTKQNFQFISNQFQNSFSILHQTQIIMEETIHLSDLWVHTITKVFKLDPKYKVDQMIRQWVI